MGQSLDLLTAAKKTEDGRVDIDSFDLKTHANIVKFIGMTLGGNRLNIARAVVDMECRLCMWERK